MGGVTEKVTKAVLSLETVYSAGETGPGPETPVVATGYGREK